MSLWELAAASEVRILGCAFVFIRGLVAFVADVVGVVEVRCPWAIGLGSEPWWRRGCSACCAVT